MKFKPSCPAKQSEAPRQLSIPVKHRRAITHFEGGELPVLVEESILPAQLLVLAGTAGEEMPDARVVGKHEAADLDTCVTSSHISKRERWG